MKASIDTVKASFDVMNSLNIVKVFLGVGYYEVLFKYKVFIRYFEGVQDDSSLANSSP